MKKQFVKFILKVLGKNMKIIFDNNKKLDGMKSKVLNTSLAKKYGWYPKVKLEDAILKTYLDLEKNYKNIRN